MEAIEEVRRHPAFQAAIEASARGFVEQYFGARLVNLIASDRGRTFAAGMALYLHFSGERPGFTAAELKTLAVREDICSAGRATALIALMQWGGYLVAETVDGKVRRLVPTERLLHLHRQRWRIQLSAMAPIFPDIAAAADRLAEPAFLKAYALAQAEQFFAGFRVRLYAPQVAGFFHRNAGMALLFSLLLSELDPSAPPLSATGLSKRFQVSRQHVTGVLRQAAAAGLLTSSDPGVAGPLLSPQLRADAERFFAALYLFNTDCARAALRAAPGRDGAPARAPGTP